MVIEQRLINEKTKDLSFYRRVIKPKPGCAELTGGRVTLKFTA